MKNFIFGFLFGVCMICGVSIPLYLEITSQRDEIKKSAEVYVSLIKDRIDHEFEIGSYCGVITTISTLNSNNTNVTVKTLIESSKQLRSINSGNIKNKFNNIEINQTPKEE